MINQIQSGFDSVGVFGKIREGSLVGSEEDGEDEGECREDGFWDELELEVELELGGKVL